MPGLLVEAVHQVKHLVTVIPTNTFYYFRYFSEGGIYTRYLFRDPEMWQVPFWDIFMYMCWCLFLFRIWNSIGYEIINVDEESPVSCYLGLKSGKISPNIEVDKTQCQLVDTSYTTIWKNKFNFNKEKYTPLIDWNNSKFYLEEQEHIQTEVTHIDNQEHTCYNAAKKEFAEST